MSTNKTVVPREPAGNCRKLALERRTALSPVAEQAHDENRSRDLAECSPPDRESGYG